MKKLIIIALTISLLLTSCGKEEKTIVKHYWTWIVETWSIDLNTSFVWYVESENTVNLSAKMWWKITAIYKKQWDKVIAWELVAELDWSEAKTWYSSVWNIITSLETMKTQTSTMFDAQIEAMQAKVEQAQAWTSWVIQWLSDTKNITENQLQTAKSQVEQASIWLETTKTNLEQTKIVLETNREHIYKNTINAITNSVILDTNILNFSDILLWITDENEDKNDSFEDYLSAKNTKYLKEAEKEFLEVNKLFIEYKKIYEEKIEDKTPDNETIKEIAENWVIIAEKLKVLLSTVYDVLDNSIDNVQLSQATIDSYKSQISTMWQNIEASLLSVSWDYILWLKGSIENMESFNSESSMQLSLLEKQVSLAEKGLETAQNTYEQYQAISQWQVNEVSTKKEIAELSLKEAQAWLEALKKQKQTSISEIDAKIKEAQAEQNNAWVMISNSKIISPVTWVITNKLAEVWQVVWWWMPVLIVSNESDLKIKIWVDDDTLESINVWDTVKIEAENNDKQINWTVKNIYPSKDYITKKNIVEVSLDDNIKIWTIVSVYFEQKTENTSIIISNSAIIQKFMLPWVYVLEDWKAIFKNIEILEQNDNFSKVSWLKAWEIIITSWKENIYDWEKL